MGEILTYKEAAELTDHPKSWRAVGNTLNKNKNLHPPKFSKKI
ncbi:MAG: MGMT family protein [Candidatus Nealsonbacteria bacterium]|nr:MGMT family protein [Candidatus Nealsonbacteria bacterium]